MKQAAMDRLNELLTSEYAIPYLTAEYADEMGAGRLASVYGCVHEICEIMETYPDEFGTETAHGFAISDNRAWSALYFKMRQQQHANRFNR